MPGEATFSIDLADAVAANRLWFGRRLWRPKILIVYLLYLAFCAVIGVALSPDQSDVSGLAITVAEMMLAATAMFVLLFGLSYLLLPRRAGRLFRQQRMLALPTTYTWSDENITQASAQAHVIYSWSDFHRQASSRDLLMLMQTEKSFLAFPRAKMSEAAFANLAEIVARLGPPQL
jgi:hypothetical protein